MLSKQYKELIQQYIHHDVRYIAFKKFSDDIDVPFLIQQIKGRKLTPKKYPSWENHLDDLVFPKQLSLEQSSSEFTALYKAQLVSADYLVDLTGGFGIDTSFFARHIKQVTYVEQQKDLVEIAKHNFNVLGLSNINTINDVAENIVSTISADEIVYIDPARRNEQGSKVFRIEDCTPNIINLLEVLKHKTKKIIIKLSPMYDTEMAIKQVDFLSEIHIVAVDNECKELVLIVEPHTKKTSISYYCVNIDTSGPISMFSFNKEALGLDASYTNEIKKYIYEPNVAIMKTGAFGTISKRFLVDKIHPNSHLFTSDTFVNMFPGRQFELVSVIPFKKENIKLEISPLKKANITVRNFPLEVNEIRNKTKLKEGGECYIFATTLYNNDKVCLLCKRITNQK